MMTSPIVFWLWAASTVLGGTRFDLSAESWVNPPTIRFADERTFVVLFFSTEDNHEETKEFFERLSKLKRRRNFFVLALSSEREERVRTFAKRLKVDVPLGAGSKSFRQFKVKRFPTLIMLERSSAKTPRWTEIGVNVLDKMVPAELGPGIVSGEFDDSSTQDELIRHAYDDPDTDECERALELLRTRMSAEEFLDLCDALLGEGDPATQRYGRIDYQRHSADPSIVEKRLKYPPSSLAKKSRREQPDDPRWSRLDQFEKDLPNKTVEQLWSDYQASLTDDPSDALMRMAIADRLEKHPDKNGARSMLKRMYPGEPDDGVRLHIVGSMADLSGPGDTDAADFLEAHVDQEENILWVRPLMLRTVRYLRTGE